MAMRTAAKSISQRLFCGARNFSEMSMCSDCVEELRLQPNKCPICTQPVEELIGIKAESHSFHEVIRQLPQLTKEVEELSTKLKYLKDTHRRVVEVAHSDRTYLTVTDRTLYVLGGASAVGGYIYGTTVEDYI